MAEPVLEFTIKGEPVPKERPRFGRHGAWTPEKTKQGEEQVRWEYIAQCGNRLVFPVATPVQMTIECRHHDFTQPEGALWIDTPDWDNLGKLISDALNRLPYVDDRQLSTVVVRKRITNGDPLTLVRLAKDGGIGEDDRPLEDL